MSITLQAVWTMSVTQEDEKSVLCLCTMNFHSHHFSILFELIQEHMYENKYRLCKLKESYRRMECYTTTAAAAHHQQQWTHNSYQYWWQCFWTVANLCHQVEYFPPTADTIWTKIINTLIRPNWTLRFECTRFYSSVTNRSFLRKLRSSISCSLENL
jgi:hypothetical protein